MNIKNLKKKQIKSRTELEDSISQCNEQMPL